MVGFVVGVVAAGGAALYWLTSSGREAKAKDREREICTGCTQAAMQNRLEEIVRHVEYPCRECISAMERYSSDHINRLKKIGGLPETTQMDGYFLYNCYDKLNPNNSYNSQTPINCRPTFSGNGISPAEAREEAHRLEMAREMIRIKANRPILGGSLEGI